MELMINALQEYARNMEKVNPAKAFKKQAEGLRGTSA